nr:MAG TPA: putative terminase small subunit [Caudoviricetes sp.]
MARPRKEIDQKQFENLCGLQCTLEEICGWFDVCSDTLETWCKRTYKRSFSEVFAQKRGVGKISLRRSQWRLAEKSASMAIFLGKQYLGQRDNVDVTVAGEKNNLLEAIAKTGEINTDDLPEVE